MPCTAGLIMIGDEILKGQIIDTNSHFVTKRLHSIGIKVCKIVVIADDVDEIALEVMLLSSKYNFVITSGGIGPTHDDVTFSGVAKAFDEPIVLNSDLARMIQRIYPGSVNDVKANLALKMAQVPKCSKLLYLKQSKSSDCMQSFDENFPIVQVRNVYIFPGIPELFEYSFIHLETIFKNAADCKFYTRELFLNLSEVTIAPILNRAVERYTPTVVFGSYPSLSSVYYLTKLTMESTSQDHVQEAEEFLRQELPMESIVDCHQNLPPLGMESPYDVAQMMRGKFSNAIKKAINVLEECCDKYKASEIFLSFNGGKDCTVLLHLACTVFKQKFPDCKEKLQALYIQNQNPFPEVETFIEESHKRYDLDLMTELGPIKNALGIVLSQKPQLKAVLMGTRRTDPYAEHLNHFQKTDEGWPQVMRVSPLLDWNYDDIWTYLRDFGVPYCSLYDEGYTSLGNRHNTTPNPALSFTTGNGSTHYRPAHMLVDWSAERNGRC